MNDIVIRNIKDISKCIVDLINFRTINNRLLDYYEIGDKGEDISINCISLIDNLLSNYISLLTSIIEEDIFY